MQKNTLPYLLVQCPSLYLNNPTIPYLYSFSQFLEMGIVAMKYLLLSYYVFEPQCQLSTNICVIDGQRPKSSERSSPSLPKRIKVERVSEEIPVKVTNKIRHDPSKLRFLEGLGLVTVDRKKGNLYFIISN